MATPRPSAQASEFFEMSADNTEPGLGGRSTVKRGSPRARMPNGCPAERGAAEWGEAEEAATF